MNGRLLFIGNFEPPHSTENELRRAFEAHGWDVDQAAEADVGTDAITADRIMRADLVLYVATQGITPNDADWLWGVCHDNAVNVPTACFHLDLLYGLGTPKGKAGIPRALWPAQHPQFRAHYAFTADGGHQREFLGDGVDHYWLPPGVSEFECIPGTPRREYEADVTFVGSWDGYHPESTHRRDLIRFLRREYGARLQLIPEPGQPALRREALRDLYASTRVVVGDSCMYGYEAPPRYCSDRIPETLGRGGFLIHPEVEGIFPQLWRSGEHLATWHAGDWDALGEQIDYYLAKPEERAEIAAAGRVHTLVRHTYTSRVRSMLDVMGLWGGGYL